jgi:hypothetical protein
VINLSEVTGGGEVAPGAITNAGGAFTNAANEFAGNLVAIWDDGADTTVYVDVNGDDTFNAGDMQIELTGTGLGVVAADFVV